MKIIFDETITKGRNPPTAQQIDDIASLANSAAAFIEILTDYLLYRPNKKAAENTATALTAVSLLLESVAEYMIEYAGEPPAPESSEPCVEESRFPHGRGAKTRKKTRTRTNLATCGNSPQVFPPAPGGRVIA